MKSDLIHKTKKMEQYTMKWVFIKNLIYKNNSKGFSLIELMVVMSIMGLVIGLSIPSVAILKIRAAQAEKTTYMREIFSLAHSFHGEYGRYPTYFNHGQAAAGEVFCTYVDETDGADPGLAEHGVKARALGFWTPDCYKLRYLYSFTSSSGSGGVDPTYGLQWDSSAGSWVFMAHQNDGQQLSGFGLEYGGKLYFTISATSISMSGYTVGGNHPTNLCRNPVSGSRPFFYDAWYMYENSSLHNPSIGNGYPSNGADARVNCFAKWN